MKRSIEEAVRRAGGNGQAAFIPFVTGGYPDPETFLEIMSVLDKAGADVIEIGLPFSDPLADGPVIQHSSQQALENGITPAKVLDLAAQAGARVKCPLVIMSYFNPIQKMGLAAFASRAVDSGVSGTIIPDLPLEEAEDWMAAAEPFGLDTIFLAAPTSPPHRLKRIMMVSQGFLYYVSMTGVTGSDFSVSPELLGEISQIRTQAPLPVAVGFGVKNGEQARALGTAADGVIVGSALIRAIMDAQDREAQIRAVADLAGELGQALHQAA